MLAPGELHAIDLGVRSSSAWSCDGQRAAGVSSGMLWFASVEHVAAPVTLDTT